VLFALALAAFDLFVRPTLGLVALDCVDDALELVGLLRCFRAVIGSVQFISHFRFGPSGGRTGLRR